MFASIRKSYNHTIYASYVGYITQAIVNNLAPLLFLVFMGEFGLNLESITLLTTVNFATQLLVDLLSTKVVDRLGYRSCIVAAHVLSFLGLTGMTWLPGVLPPFAGLLASVVLYAIGGGLIEVLISPIVEACPTEKKAAAMSLLHSFYCWGQMGLVLLSSAYFALVGTGAWRALAWLWSLVPLANVFYFLCVPLYPIVAGNTRQLTVRELFGRKVFWLLLAMMVCAGASELAMSQWASAFAERGLGLSKTLGDLAGPCAFAALMGTARALYGKFSEKIPLKRCMMASSALCVLCYALAAFSGSPAAALVGCAVCGFSVGLFWPGTFSIAAPALPGGGTAMYALLALAGDLGCSGGPTVVGLVSNACGGELSTGLAVAMVFPFLMLILTALVRQPRPVEASGKN